MTDPVETENSEPARDADGPLDAFPVPDRRQVLTRKSLASAAAVALALTAAVIWKAMSDNTTGVDADSVAYAEFDPGSATGSGPTGSPSETAGTGQESGSPSVEAEPTGETTTAASASDTAENATALPGTGVYRARQEASGLCMTWGEEPGGDRSVLVLGDCGSTEPELTWVKDGGAYFVEMAFDDWTPCMTADNGGTEDGMLVGFDGCDGLDAQTWELLPTGSAYQLRTAASDTLCLAVLKSSSSESGDAVALQNCDSGDAEQLWMLL
ncbi:RICIN domain-containing protein [Glycomyces albidus]|uniref:Ricin B lectin domain-containing protein n=1 Tax=Glycomyces albidus TaxID=2656774 RepID=A0A6L5G487_9ACTN|nr:ricin-type beta-trefoil lectin domain protein [Glycomyces albidus]MQM24455.1 hypothetical protein [Glycomyces albidus]